MKKFVYLFFCVLFAWSGLAVWNWAHQIASAVHVSVNLVDCMFVLLIFVSLIFSALFVEQTDKQKKA